MLLPPKRGQSYVPERWPNNASLPLGRAIWFNPGRVPLLGIFKKWRSPSDNPKNYTSLVRNWFPSILLATNFQTNPLGFWTSSPAIPSWTVGSRNRGEGPAAASLAAADTDLTAKKKHVRTCRNAHETQQERSFANFYRSFLISVPTSFAIAP